MFKTLVIVVFCAVALAESLPTEEKSHRFARQAQDDSQGQSSSSGSGIPNNPMAMGINLATQMGSTAAEAAQSAIKVGEQAMQGMAQAAAAGTQLFPGFG